MQKQIIQAMPAALRSVVCAIPAAQLPEQVCKPAKCSNRPSRGAWAGGRSCEPTGWVRSDVLSSPGGAVKTCQSWRAHAVPSADR